jgi:hypothetical protein
MIVGAGAQVTAPAKPAPVVPGITRQKAVLAAADKFDQKVITLRGVVQEFEQRTSRRGNPYYVLKLAEGSDRIAIYGRGVLKPALKNGEKAEARGLFQKEKRVGSQTFKNELTITDRSEPKHFVKAISAKE